MNALDAAAVVLKEAESPLHYREITRLILERGLWSTSGQTPWNTVNAQLATDVRDRGMASRFIRTKPGHFALKPEQIEEAPPTERTEVKRPAEQESTSHMSFTDAAEQVLLQSRSREPLHYRTITDRALEQALIRTEGRTPVATMSSAIREEIRRRDARGDTQRFVWHGKGMVGLASWVPVGVAALIDENNQEVHRSLLDQARKASPAAFEELVEELLKAMGFQEVERTNISSDGGIDVRGTLVVGDAVRVRMAVQAKRWKGNVQAPIVQQVRGSLGAHEQGLIITTSDFSLRARDEAIRSDAAPVALMNGDQLAKLLARHNIGARVETYDLLTLDDEWELQE